MIKTRLRQFDILKGIGILLVLIGHSEINSLGRQWIYGFHMPLFFFCSGIFYKQQQFFTTIKNNAVQLLVPYVFFCIVLNLCFLLIQLKGGDWIGYVDLLQQNCNPFIEDSYLYLTIWFLPCLFIVKVLYTLLYNLFNNQYITAIVVGGGI